MDDTILIPLPCLSGKSLTNMHHPQFISQVFTEKRPLDTVAVGALARVFETVGLSLWLNYWGVRSNPFD